MFRKAVSIIKNIGLKNLGKKGMIYVYRKSGLQAVLSRSYSYDRNLYPKFGNLIWDWEKVGFLTSEHINNVSAYLHTLPADIQEEIRKKGNEILNGYYTLFSYHTIFQEQINFNLDPLDNIFWNEKKHSSLFTQFDRKLGDIKRVWELNRFVFADMLVPLYHLETDIENKGRIQEAFLHLLKSWLNQNKHERTVAWSCSQEISIRCINLIFIFRHLECEEDKIEKMFKHMLALSAQHVYTEIEYAKTQRNNHALTESAFLILFSSVFPRAKLSDKFYQKGIDTLSFCLNDQFFSDGTYIQNSLTYQRFALQCIVTVAGLVRESPLGEKLVDILNKNIVFLYNLMFGSEGDFPNYGPNDGSLLFNWSGSDYRDMRPLLNLLSIKTKRKLIFAAPDSLIDAAFLTDGFDASLNEVYKPDKKERFDQSGYYVMKNKAFAILFRCGSYNFRYPSQNDMLHVDVWINKMPVLNDSGTFEYFGVSGIKNFHYFLSTAAHNTIRIGKLDQLDKGPRFIWLSSINAKLMNWSEYKITGESYAYKGRLKGDPIHRRKLELFYDHLVISDELINIQNHFIELFWHAAEDENISNINETSFRLDKQNVTISFDSNSLFTIDIIETPSSKYYAESSKRKAFVIRTKGQYKTVTIKTTLHLKYENITPASVFFRRK